MTPLYSSDNQQHQFMPLIQILDIVLDQNTVLRVQGNFQMQHFSTSTGSSMLSMHALQPIPMHTEYSGNIIHHVLNAQQYQQSMIPVAMSSTAATAGSASSQPMLQIPEASNANPIPASATAAAVSSFQTSNISSSSFPHDDSMPLKKHYIHATSQPSSPRKRERPSMDELASPHQQQARPAKRPKREPQHNVAADEDASQASSPASAAATVDGSAGAAADTQSNEDTYRSEIIRLVNEIARYRTTLNAHGLTWAPLVDETTPAASAASETQPQSLQELRRQGRLLELPHPEQSIDYILQCFENQIRLDDASLNLSLRDQVFSAYLPTLRRCAADCATKGHKLLLSKSRVCEECRAKLYRLIVGRDCTYAQTKQAHVKATSCLFDLLTEMFHLETPRNLLIDRCLTRIYKLYRLGSKDMDFFSAQLRLGFAGLAASSSAAAAVSDDAATATSNEQPNAPASS